MLFIQLWGLIGFQTGAVFMINGAVVGMDAFGKPETFSKTFRKLVQSYAMDVIDWLEQEKEQKSSKSDITNFTKGVLACKVEAHDSVGMGTDFRLESNKLTGFALAFDGKVVHMSVFAREGDGKGGSESSQMARYSRRRRNRT